MGTGRNTRQDGRRWIQDLFCGHSQCVKGGAWVPTRSAQADNPDNTRSAWWKDPGLRINVLHCMGACICPFYLGCECRVGAYSRRLMRR